MVIAGRLAELGHGRDFLEPGAVDELLVRSRHVAGGVQAALAATLFLASTEDAPRIERAHVERAVPDDWLAGPEAGRSRIGALGEFGVAGGLAALFCVLVLWPASLGDRALQHRTGVVRAAPSAKREAVRPALPVAAMRVVSAPGRISNDAAGDFARAVRLDLAGDAAKAFALYMAAARAGLPAAQFNVGLNYDSGRGAPHDAAAAALYYAFAASNFYPQAAYNLGLLYAAGDGVPRNRAMARAWLNVAASEGLGTVGVSVPAALAGAPAPIAAQAIYPGEGAVLKAGQDFVPLVWAAPAEAAPVTYSVQLVALDGAAPRDVLSVTTDVSAARAPIGRRPGRYAWRIFTMCPSMRASAATRWTEFSVE